LLHVPKPIKFHDPIVTFKMFIFVIIIELHIIWNMSWVYKHVTQPSMMWSIPCFIVNEWYPPEKCLCMWEWPQFGVYTCSLVMPIHMCNKIFWWMGISPCKWHWEGVGSIRPKLHHSQGLVGTHGWME
jgi:hypothetical protein